MGMISYQNIDYAPKHLDVLSEYLAGLYGPDHKVIVYEASLYPIFDPVTEVMPISHLPEARVSPISTLYVPPKNAHAPLDNEMLERLGMDEKAIHRIELKLYARHHRADATETVSLTRR